MHTFLVRQCRTSKSLNAPKNLLISNLDHVYKIKHAIVLKSNFVLSDLKAYIVYDWRERNNRSFACSLPHKHVYVTTRIDTHVVLSKCEPKLVFDQLFHRNRQDFLGL